MDQSDYMPCGHQLRHWMPKEGTITGALLFQRDPTQHGSCQICRAIVEERKRILAIIEKEPWEVYGDDYYTTYDAQTSIAKLKALIEKGSS